MAMWAYSVDNSSMGYAYIEGCQRGWLDGELVQIGDGEDYFDSSYGFDAGTAVKPYAALVELLNLTLMVPDGVRVFN